MCTRIRRVPSVAVYSSAHCTDAGLSFEGLGFRVEGFGFMIYDLWFMVCGLELMV